MSFFCTVLDGVFTPYGDVFIVGREKLGMLVFIADAEDVVLLAANGELAFLVPNGVVGTSSFRPVAITVILA